MHLSSWAMAMSKRVEDALARVVAWSAAEQVTTPCHVHSVNRMGIIRAWTSPLPPFASQAILFDMSRRRNRATPPADGSMLMGSIHHGATREA